MMNTILDAAEARIPHAAAAAQMRQKEIVEGMRTEVGQHHYQQAQLELAKLEKFCTKELRPYLDRFMRLGQHATAPLPSDIRGYVRELEDFCAYGTDWVRSGIAEWNGLAAPFVPGTQQIDQARRSGEVDSIRKKLMNWNGKESRGRDLMASIDRFIAETGWPTP